MLIRPEPIRALPWQPPFQNQLFTILTSFTLKYFIQTDLKHDQCFSFYQFPVDFRGVFDFSKKSKMAGGHEINMASYDVFMIDR